jgi:L-ribulose-5-phosphate 3-epimerase
MNRIGILQGRLVPPEAGRFQSFPRASWRQEFQLAAEAGLEAIEWIYDTFGEDINPIASDQGISEIQRLSRQHGVFVSSVCADYFMERRLLGEGAEHAQSIERLRWLLKRCGLLGISRVVLPFLDTSRIRNDVETRQLVGLLEIALRDAEEAGVELHLEMDLEPVRFAGFLKCVEHPSIKVTYDSGNSTSLGYSPREEFDEYGSRIGSVHVKDRVLGGVTVPLGQGDADFASVFDGLRRLGFSGDLVLQVSRAEPGTEVAWAKANAVFVRRFLQRYELGTGGAGI